MNNALNYILSNDSKELASCLAEAVDIIEGIRMGSYKPDCMTTQPWLRALKNYNIDKLFEVTEGVDYMDDCPSCGAANGEACVDGGGNLQYLKMHEIRIK